MNWWTVFFRVRKTVFFFISITSLLWATVLSAYIARLWTHLLWSQRTLVLAIIGANVFTAIMMYLMAVVVFRVWMDLARVFFLLLIHIASALMFTLFGSNLSCATFDTQKICKHVDLAFVIGSWVMTGLLLGYIPYLLIMLRVPRPIPKITHNPLLDTPPMSRRSSVSSFGSVSSTTRLIRSDSAYSSYTTLPDTRKTVAQRSFGYPTASTPARRGPPPIYTNGSNRAVDTPPANNLIRSVSVTPPTPRATTNIPMPGSLQTAEALSQSSRNSTPRPLPTPPLFTNPFLDPLSRTGTPQTAFSQMSFNTSTTSPPRHSRANSNLDQWPPLVAYPTTAASATNASSAPRSSDVVPVWSPYEGRWVYSSSPERPRSGRPNLVLAGSTLRDHTKTPHSIHSVAASMHMHHLPDPISHTPPAPVVHARARSDPIYRPATVAPGGINPDDPLPNPFPLVSATEVRRFGSVPSAQFYVGQGGTYNNVRNAAHLAGALGRTPPRSEVAVADSERWKQLVFTAATGRTM
ncbi:hypothetical protein BC835DRAFT_1378881 [Cytidiella melzeri]|nr:hypothetical protein BC835DRAFT_1378881 [Cytidiella melzeri]